MIFTSGLIFTALTTNPPAAGTLLGADMGLSTDLATGTIAQLGQTVGRAGDPAILTEEREIPDPGGHNIYIGRNNGVDNVLALGPDFAVEVANNTGFGFIGGWNIGANTNSIEIHTDDGAQILMDFINVLVAGGSIIYSPSPTNLNRFETTIPFVMQGTGAKNRTVNSDQPIMDLDCFIYVDTSTAVPGAGITLTFPAPAGIINQIFYIKKTTADIEAVHLATTTGTIQAIGAPAATYVSTCRDSQLWCTVTVQTFLFINYEFTSNQQS